MGKKRSRLKNVPQAPERDSTLLVLASPLPSAKREAFLDKVAACSPDKVPAPYILGWEPVRAWVVMTAYEGTSSKKRRSRNNNQVAYHGTRFANVASIVASNFRLPNHTGMFGKAIYLTPNADKAIGYTGTADRRKTHAYILVCRVDLGRNYQAPSAMHDLDLKKINALGYDTVTGQSGKTTTHGSRKLFHTEYAVYDPKRIKVTHIVEYEQVRVSPRP